MAGESFKELRKRVKNKELPVDDLYQYNQDFLDYSLKIMNGKKYTLEELENFLVLCLDFYAFSESGKVLIPDRNYDICMKTYMSHGEEMIIFPDKLLDYKQWEFVEHKLPGLVGSLGKIYTYEELKDFCQKNNGITEFILAPKFDGISAAIQIKDGALVYAATRYNGLEGQNILPVLRRAKFHKNKKFFGEKRGIPEDGFYKCEIVVSHEDLEQIHKYKDYANRRSATSGIINAPKNVDLGRFLTIIPLLKYDKKKNHIDYIPLHSKRSTFYHPRDLMNAVEEMMYKYKDKDYPYRVDGVVIWPVLPHLAINPNDFMDEAIAYKINTSEGRTRVKYGYMTVGRMGNAIPMLKVEPVEVNETTVTDVSLGSYDKFLSMHLTEDEEVIVYSAGDVIPQIKLPETRHNIENKPDIKIKKVCPYCGEKLTRFNTEYKCTNSNCIRVITGRIANFTDKLGMMGFSDATIEALYNNGLVKSIEDLFSLEESEVAKMEGWSTKSASNLIKEIEKLRTTPIPVSRLFGALGIENISEKKCRKIFEYIHLDKILSSSEKKIFDKILQADGIGVPTAKIFVEFVSQNRSLIAFLIETMHITDDAQYKGNVVFTGFRNKDWEAKFKSIGFDVSNSVTANTRAVISGDMYNKSSKCKQAQRKGIEIVQFDAIQSLYDELKFGKL